MLQKLNFILILFVQSYVNKSFFFYNMEETECELTTQNTLHHDIRISPVMPL